MYGYQGKKEDGINWDTGIDIYILVVVISLLFNMLPRFVIAFLPRSKCLLISWFQSPSTVILVPRKIKSVTVSTFSPSVCHKVVRPNAMILVFLILSFKPGNCTHCSVVISKQKKSKKEGIYLYTSLIHFALQQK